MNDLESIKKSIVNGLGISILSARSVQNLEQTKQILVFPLEESQSKRLFYIAYSRHRILTRREQEIPRFYKWWDELRLTRRFLDFRILLYYNVFTNQSYLMERI